MGHVIMNNIYNRLQARYDSMTPDLDDEHTLYSEFEDKKAQNLAALIKAANDDDSELNVISLLADYINFVNSGNASNDQLEDVYTFINQTVTKPRWLNLNAGERLVEQAFNHAAELAAKEELSF